MKWKKKKEETRFLNARKGDLLCAPFQCDHCWYANIQHREANDWYPSDARQLAYIRRVNLDIFWSREPSTVASTHNTITRARKCSEDLGLEPIKIHLGPWPVADTCGFQVAIEMLKHSQGQGKNDASYIQYDSIRKARSAYSNVFEGGPVRCLDNRKLKTEKGQMLSFVSGPTDSKLFSMFMMGCEKRMGRFVKQDVGISLPVLQEMLNLYDEELKNVNVSLDRKRSVIVCAAAFVILWAGALRGGEVFMLEASELVKRRNDGRNDKHGHCVIPLMGRFKQESGERNLLMVLANRTKGGLEVRRWVDLLTSLLKAEGKMGEIGPAICNENGFMLEKWKLNGELHSILGKIQDANTGIIPAGIVIEDKYNVYRSFRRGATTRAKEQGVDEATIEMNNRWRKWQNKRGSLPNLPMTQLYVEISQALVSKLRFSSSL
jgi:predicted Zn-ribbon and HTH transcriptional regulator